MKKIFTILGVSAALFMNAQIIINEVYGGGGNSGATYKYDYVELKNIGTSTETLTGASIQYASATGTFNSYVSLPDITLEAGQTYLIQFGTQNATVGGNLPTPDYVSTQNTNYATPPVTYNNTYNFSTSNGKIALASNTQQVSGPTASNVLDFIGYGTANQAEGTAANGPSNNTTAMSRTAGDTNNNSADFTVGAPTPKNSAGTTLAVDNITSAQAKFVQNTVVTDAIKFGIKSDVKVYNMNGQVVKTAAVEKGSTLNVSSLPKGIYIVTGNIEGQIVSQKITKN